MNQIADVAGLFPLPKGGGPIEALTTASHPHGQCSRGFHYRKAVAPLKRGLCFGRQFRFSSFHYRKAVAPLKQDDHLDARRPTMGVSTTERRWPH